MREPDMVTLQFYSDINFEGFLDDVRAVLGTVPGTVDEQARNVVLSAAEYEEDAVDFIEMVRDYGGRISHHK